MLPARLRHYAPRLAALTLSAGPLQVAVVALGPRRRPPRPPRRKHTFSPEAHLRRGVLNIVVVKDPYFWAASMRRNPYQARIDTSDLSAPFEYQGRLLHGVADYWYE